MIALLVHIDLDVCLQLKLSLSNDLCVQLGVELVLELFEFSSSFLDEEQFGCLLYDQLFGFTESLRQVLFDRTV